MKKIFETIKTAELQLPGTPAPEGETDPRWQAIISVGEYIEDYPFEVWQFVEKWGTHPSKDLRMAIATCLLEHLLEYHFKQIFPLVEKAAKKSRRFAETFGHCFDFGEALEPENQKRIAKLKKTIHENKVDKPPQKVLRKKTKCL